MTTIRETLTQATEHHLAGRIQDAERIYREVLAIDPQQVDALHLLGLIAHQVGKDDDAVALMMHAIKIQPNFPTAFNNLAGVFSNLGRLDEAINAYRQAVLLLPSYAEAHHNLGIACYKKGLFDEAIDQLQRAIQLNYATPQGHLYLGSSLRKLGRLEEAVVSYQQAVTLDLNYVDALLDLARTYTLLSQLDNAEASYRRALELRPNDAVAHDGLGATLLRQRRFVEAIGAFQQAVALDRSLYRSYCNLAVALVRNDQVDEAIEVCRQAIGIDPSQWGAYIELGNALKEKGELREAIKCYRQSLAINPKLMHAFDNVLLAMQYLPEYDPQTICAEHRKWGREFADSLAPFNPLYPNDRSPDRPLRIGYVSADFMNHPVGRYMLPVLENHDRKQFQIVCYSSLEKSDPITASCQRNVDAWRDVTYANDEQLADVIRQDQIDILIDLSSHTKGNRLLTFARKPAPVQVTYLGLVGTTGLRTIDYRLTDPYLDSPSANSVGYSEESVFLPETIACYRSLVTTESVKPPPAAKSGVITFGCLNNFCKLSDDSLDLWVEILNQVPTAQLILHSRAASNPTRALDRMLKRGIAADRLTLLGLLPTDQYLQVYDRIDIALDPFPFGGLTTTCDALWMGVPVVTLPGKTPVGRGGLSILSNIGLTEFVAKDSADYLRIAVDLAHDLPRLSELRSTLRQRMQRSPLMDAPRFTRNLEAAYRQMWQRYCAK